MEIDSASDPEIPPASHEASDPCPRCEQLQDELLRSEQRNHERLREITDLCTELGNRLADGERRREEARQRLQALRNRLSPG